VVDSVELGAPRGVRTVALLVQAGPLDIKPARYVYLASGRAGRRTVRRTQLAGLDRWLRGRLGFGAVDMDGDGGREPYVVGWGSGTSLYEIELAVMHLNGRDQYTYLYRGVWSQPDLRRGSFVEGKPHPGPRIRRWAKRLAESLADSIDA
jgi:hypothetical protein